MKKSLISSLIAACLGLRARFSPAGDAADKPVVRTSAQPCLHGMELWHAEKAGWLKDAPFASEFLFFPSGAPQTEALPPISGIAEPWAPCPP